MNIKPGDIPLALSTQPIKPIGIGGEDGYISTETI